MRFAKVQRSDPGALRAQPGKDKSGSPGRRRRRLCHQAFSNRRASCENSRSAPALQARQRKRTKLRKCLLATSVSIPHHARYLCTAEKSISPPKNLICCTHMSSSPDRVITRRTLMVAVWGGYNVDQPESLRVLIGQLRRKIEPTDEPQYILTEPWVGYRFVPDGLHP